VFLKRKFVFPYKDILYFEIPLRGKRKFVFSSHKFVFLNTNLSFHQHMSPEGAEFLIVP